MSVTTAHQTTCRFCKSIEANIMLSLAFLPFSLLLHTLQPKPRMLPCQAIMKKQSVSSKPCKSIVDLQAQVQASFYLTAAILIGA
jgi:hypothetical protein